MELGASACLKFIPLIFLICSLFFAASLLAQTTNAPSTAARPIPIAAVNTNSVPHFEVNRYILKFNPAIFTNTPTLGFSDYTGKNVGLDRVVQAAADVLFTFQKQGYRKVNVSIGMDGLTNGIATLNIFQGVFPQVLISGKPFLRPDDKQFTPVFAVTQPGEATKTNPVRHFNIRAYEITGDTLLTTNTLMSIFTKYTGTNLTLTNIYGAATELQREYRDRGYATVSVAVPPQTIGSNGIVKIRVFEGILSEIRVTHNRYFSSNNVMRAMPSLRTNMLLIRPVFQAELDRANADQDRQIYPQIEPGPEPNTTLLTLRVEDRFPMHAKLEIDNQNSPGTPDLRINGSASYQNLWQMENSAGIQYGFSPEKYKQGDLAQEFHAGVLGNFYDKPLVANYGGFYRLPIGNYVAMEEPPADSSGGFGYDEATRKFRLPPASGRPELNIFASRSTIDTGIETTFSGNIYNTNGNRLDRQDLQQDLTLNSDAGARLSLPFLISEAFQAGFSGGLDYKSYQLTSYKTNNFTLNSQVLDTLSGSQFPITNINTSIIQSPVPVTVRSLEYLPLTLRYDASLRDSRGVTAFGLGLNVNAWFSGTLTDLRNVTSSQKSYGHWVTLNPSMSRDFTFRTNWVLTLRADGQWASEPLISNEEFGVGGLASVRGYHEGEVFGDTGWHITLDQKTPPFTIGTVYAKHPLTVRGAVFMDYGEAYLLDPQGRQSRTSLWGTGFGGVATIGANWEARLLFAVPFQAAGTVGEEEPRFNFSVSAQF